MRGTWGTACVLARKDLLLEVRSRELTLALALFVLGALVLFHFALAGTTAAHEPRVASGLLWVAVLLGAVLALDRAFAAERDDGLLDALVLAPVPRPAIWLGKALTLATFLLVLEVVAVPLTWLLFLAGHAHSTAGAAGIIAALLLADVGIACVGSLVASLASAARQREVLLPLVFLPVATPVLILGLAATRAAQDGSGAGRYLALIALYDAVFALLAWGAYESVITE
jgi:heme exporter protein B